MISLKNLVWRANSSLRVFVTISWQEALNKLKAFKAGDPKAYLLFLVSAGLSYGARNVSIRENADETEITMHDCYVPEEQVRHGFRSIVEGALESASFDLAMGFHSGLLNGFTQAELSAEAPDKPCYKWNLSKNHEKNSTPLLAVEQTLTRI